MEASSRSNAAQINPRSAAGEVCGPAFFVHTKPRGRRRRSASALRAQPRPADPPSGVTPATPTPAVEVAHTAEPTQASTVTGGVGRMPEPRRGTPTPSPDRPPRQHDVVSGIRPDRPGREPKLADEADEVDEGDPRPVQPLSPPTCQPPTLAADPAAESLAPKHAGVAPGGVPTPAVCPPPSPPRPPVPVCLPFSDRYRNRRMEGEDASTDVATGYNPPSMRCSADAPLLPAADPATDSTQPAPASPSSSPPPPPPPPPSAIRRRNRKAPPNATAAAATRSPPSTRRRQLDLSEVAKHAKTKLGKSLVKQTLAGLPSQPVFWDTLTTLYLSGNQLMWLPDSVGTLTGLTELWVSHNRLTELPASIGGLTELTFLRANNNRLQRLPSSLGGLRRLQRLHLGRNELLLLPDEIGQLGELRELLLSSNRIAHLPETIGYLRSLVKLHVCKNDLRRLPDALAHLRELKSKSHSIEWLVDKIYIACVPWRI